jgi:hypothetical protein
VRKHVTHETGVRDDHNAALGAVKQPLQKFDGSGGTVLRTGNLMSGSGGARQEQPTRTT